MTPSRRDLMRLTALGLAAAGLPRPARAMVPDPLREAVRLFTRATTPAAGGLGLVLTPMATGVRVGLSDPGTGLTEALVLVAGRAEPRLARLGFGPATAERAALFAASLGAGEQVVALGWRGGADYVAVAARVGSARVVGDGASLPEAVLAPFGPDEAVPADGAGGVPMPPPRPTWLATPR